jgi:hypothetical protein
VKAGWNDLWRLSRSTCWKEEIPGKSLKYIETNIYISSSKPDFRDSGYSFQEDKMDPNGHQRFMPALPFDKMWRTCATKYRALIDFSRFHHVGTPWKSTNPKMTIHKIHQIWIIINYRILFRTDVFDSMLNFACTAGIFRVSWRSWRVVLSVRNRIDATNAILLVMPIGLKPVDGTRDKSMVKLCRANKNKPKRHCCSFRCFKQISTFNSFNRSPSGNLTNNNHGNQPI